MYPRSSLVDRLISLAVDEDLSLGDVTSRCCIPEGHRSRARIFAREELLFCGGQLLNRISECAGASVRWHSIVDDGQRVARGMVLAEAEADSRELLSLERVSLNFLQRLSGVATHVSHIVERSAGIVVLDTRKTTPGWRVLEKYATRVGGARNHRSHLGDLVLIKNNHIDAHEGDINSLFRQLRAEQPWHIPVECEVRSREELVAVLPHSPHFILLDNMNDRMIEECLSIMAQSGFVGGVEVSGGVTSDRFASLAALGVNVASMGSLTNQAVAVDISMRLFVGEGVRHGEV